MRCECPGVFFFFSSRRRHTRCLSDWSSDVCSSDLSSAGATVDVADVTEEVGIEIAFDVLNPEHPIAPWIDLYTEGGIHVFSATDTESAAERRSAGRYVTTAWIPEHLLNEGTLHVTVSLKTPQLGLKAWKHAEVESALTLQVVEQSDAHTARGPFAGRMAG